MIICVVGGGHIGTTLACFLKYTHPENTVNLYTRRPGVFLHELKCNDIENAFSYTVTLDCISNNPSIAAKRADLVYIALPHFAVEAAFSNIAPFVSKNACVGVLPGGGGCEFFFHRYFGSSQSLFGFQRVPFTAKLVDYGKETNLKSWKPYSVVGTLNRNRIDSVCAIIESSGLRTKRASNYLEIALTPTNPVLHTSRTYNLFGHTPPSYEFNSRFKFYSGWTDEASRILFAMDGELHNLLNAFDRVDTSAIRPLSEHYDSPTIEAMTIKMNSIPTFQSVYAPLKEVDGKYIADTSSRLFTEDFPWGLAIFKSYFELFQIESPTIDLVLKWYSKYMCLKWFDGDCFVGKDLKHTGVITNYGSFTKGSLMEFYLR